MERLSNIGKLTGVEKLSDRWMYYSGLLACMGVPVDDMKHIQNLIDAEEQGLLLRLPVPEGTTVYQLGYTLDCKFDYKCPLPKDVVNDCVMGFACENEEKKWKVKENTFYWKMLKSVGSTIFLTKEEAEQALAKMKEV